MGVDLRGSERSVPEKLLDGSEVRSTFDEMGGRGVTQSMRGYVGRIRHSAYKLMH